MDTDLDPVQLTAADMREALAREAAAANPPSVNLPLPPALNGILEAVLDDYIIRALTKAWHNEGVS